jgi:hypothetical protein
MEDRKNKGPELDACFGRVDREQKKMANKTVDIIPMKLEIILLYRITLQNRSSNFSRAASLKKRNLHQYPRLRQLLHLPARFKFLHWLLPCSQVKIPFISLFLREIFSGFLIECAAAE